MLISRYKRMNEEWGENIEQEKKRTRLCISNRSFISRFHYAVMAVFMRGAISNAKQEKTVDQNHLSVAAAEMGVNYYKTKFNNQFYSVRDSIWHKHFTNFRNEITNENFKGETEYNERRNIKKI